MSFKTDCARGGQRGEGEGSLDPEPEPELEPAIVADTGTEEELVNDESRPPLSADPSPSTTASESVEEPLSDLAFARVFALLFLAIGAIKGWRAGNGRPSAPST